MSFGFCSVTYYGHRVLNKMHHVRLVYTGIPVQLNAGAQVGSVYEQRVVGAISFIVDASSRLRTDRWHTDT